MRLEIKVIPGASKNMIKEEGGVSKIYLTAPPVEGKANEALIKFLAKHYDVSKSSISIIKGQASRRKVIEIGLAFLFLASFLPCAQAYNLTIFRGDKQQVFSDEELRARLHLAAVEVQDPVYNKTKHYAGFWLSDILDLAGIHPDEATVWIFTAMDGYKARITVEDVLKSNAKAFVAVKDLDAPKGWEDIQQGKAVVSPGPYYLVWQTTPETPPDIKLPWPYQMVEITIRKADEANEKIFPQDTPPSSPVRKGYKIFHQHCLACHSVNLEGGTLGPELNVPKNILEYRSRKFLRNFIADPNSFRARSKMPAFKKTLSRQSIEDVLDYLSWLSRHKISSF